MFDFIANAYPMFQEQTRIKREPEFFGDEFKMLVYPSKRKPKKGAKRGESVPRAHPPIASAVLAGFGGFLDKTFRDHDYFLGRDNARNFLRGVFMFEYDTNNLHPLFEGLTDEALDTFKVIPGSDRNPENRALFPIIPDLKKPEYTGNGKKTSPFSYTIEEYPKLTRKDIELHSSQLKARIQLMIKLKSKDWFKKSWVIRNAVLLFKGRIAKNLTKKLITKIVDELKSHRLLKS
jgi:hypothetical protein